MNPKPVVTTYLFRHIYSFYRILIFSFMVLLLSESYKGRITNSYPAFKDFHTKIQCQLRILTHVTICE